MRREWLPLLCDPLDRTPLRFADDLCEVDGRIVSGTLIGAHGRRYPIIRGIPVFITRDSQKKESVASFAYEWDEFGFEFAKSGWVDDVAKPLAGDLEFFQGKTVVDAGAGSGSQTRWMAEAGASFVFSLELSDTIFTRHRNTIRGLEDRIFPIQCDIRHPPICGPVDVLYCFNVIQHTVDPPATFRSLLSLLSPRGDFLFNIYTKRSDLKYGIVSAVRALIRPLPFRVWKALAFLITCVGWPLSHIAPLRQWLQVVVPISHSFYETWLDVYDAFGPHWYQKNMAVADQLEMIDKANLTIVRQNQFGYLLEPQETRAA